MIKILFIILSLLFLINCKSEGNDMFTKKINNWMNNSKNIILEDELGKLTNIKIDNEKNAKSIVSGLQFIKDNFDNSNFKDIKKDIYTLTIFFQNVSSKKEFIYLNSNGIPILIDLFMLLKENKSSEKSFSDPDMMILKMCSLYNNEKGLSLISKSIKESYNPNDYLWSVILSNFSEDEKIIKYLLNDIDDFLPNGFLCVSYLDMVNSALINKKILRHPFNSESGLNILKSYLENEDEEEYSYAVSSTAAIPFLDDKFQKILLSIAINHPNIDVQIEASWAGAKLGLKEYIDKLVGFSKNYRYSWKSIEYLIELKMEKLIPQEILNDDFQALSEMCKWLVHPNEYGKYPDDAIIYDKRILYWPPTKDKRTMYLIKYMYKNFNENNSDEIGIGCVGSVTFSLFDIEGINQMKPMDIYAIYCNWELEKEDWRNVEKGIEVLKKNNKF